MAGGSNKGTEPATHHEIITPSASPLYNYRSIVAVTAGTVDVVMKNSSEVETTIQYTLVAGQVMPVRPDKITAATASMAGIW